MADPNIADIVKSNFGALTGLGASKKFALTISFMGVCVTLYGLAGSLWEKIATLGAATVLGSVYIIAQAMTEKAAAVSTSEKVTSDSKAVAKK